MTETCRSTLAQLDKWLDDELSGRERDEVTLHLESCPACRQELAALEALIDQAGSLRRDLAPRQDLWPGIEQRLETRRPGRRLIFSNPSRGARWIEALAAVFVLVVLGALLWKSERTPREPPIASVREEVGIAGAPPTATAQAARARSEAGVLLTRQDLLEAVERQREHLEPETLALIEDNIRIIDEAIGEIRLALDDDPSNRQLNMLLAAQYQREVELLKQVSGV